MANFTGLAAARHASCCAPAGTSSATASPARRRSVCSAATTYHVTVHRALRLLGLGTRAHRARRRRRAGPDAPPRCATLLAAIDGPTIVCAQAGDVNTGAFDPIDEIAEVARERDGLGARRRRLRPVGRGVARAAPPRRAASSAPTRGPPTRTSGSTCRTTAASRSCAIREAHRAAMSAAGRLPGGGGGRDEPCDWTPGVLAPRPRRSRSTPRCARSGGPASAELVDRCCACARRFAERLDARTGVEVLNDVVLNQVLVRFGDDDDADAVVAACRTTARAGWARRRGAVGARCASRSRTGRRRHDVDRSVDAILGAYAAYESPPPGT